MVVDLPAPFGPKNPKTWCLVSWVCSSNNFHWANPCSCWQQVLTAFTDATIWLEICIQIPFFLGANKWSTFPLSKRGKHTNDVRTNNEPEHMKLQNNRQWFAPLLVGHNQLCWWATIKQIFLWNCLSASPPHWQCFQQNVQLEWHQFWVKINWNGTKSFQWFPLQSRSATIAVSFKKVLWAFNHWHSIGIQATPTVVNIAIISSTCQTQRNHVPQQWMWTVEEAGLERLAFFCPTVQHCITNFPTPFHNEPWTDNQEWQTMDSNQAKTSGMNVWNAGRSLHSIIHWLCPMAFDSLQLWRCICLLHCFEVCTIKNKTKVPSKHDGGVHQTMVIGPTVEKTWWNWMPLLVLDALWAQSCTPRWLFWQIMEKTTHWRCTSLIVFDRQEKGFSSLIWSMEVWGCCQQFFRSIAWGALNDLPSWDLLHMLQQQTNFDLAFCCVSPVFSPLGRRSRDLFRDRQGTTRSGDNTTTPTVITIALARY